MIRFLFKWAINTISLFLVMNIVAGVSVDSWQAIVVAAFVLGLLNAFLRPILILLTLPFNILSLGLFTFIINGLMFYLAAKFVKGFNVMGFWNAFWAALVFSVISFVLNIFLAPPRPFIPADARPRSKSYDDAIDVEAIDVNTEVDPLSSPRKRGSTE